MDDVIGFALNGEQHSLSRTQVLTVAAQGGAEPIREHWVSVKDQVWPPKQLFERASGIARTEFISHFAIRQFRRLGFTTSLLPQEHADQREAPKTGPDVTALGRAFADLVEFLTAESLTDRVGRMEQQLNGADLGNIADRDGGMTDELLRAAVLVRQHAGRVNDLIHAAMIIRALPKILKPGERIVRRPSLAAGNDPSRKFDLETNVRVAEFKAGQWKGRDAMRQRSLVADLVGLVLNRGNLRAELYVLGQLPIDYLCNSTSTVEWALGRSSPHLRAAYEQHFGSAALTVSQFTRGPAADVELVDLAKLLEIS